MGENVGPELRGSKEGEERVPSVGYSIRSGSLFSSSASITLLCNISSIICALDTPTTLRHHTEAPH